MDTSHNSKLNSEEAYQVRLEVFEGPLDLLLKLIERKQLEISKVSLAEVAEGFLAYLELHPDMPPGPLAATQARQYDAVRQVGCSSTSSLVEIPGFSKNNQPIDQIEPTS